MQGCPIVLLPILRWSISFDVVHKPRVVMLIFIVVRSWSFVWFSNFPLLLNFAKVLDLRLVELGELFIELRQCLWLLSDQVNVQRPHTQGFDSLGDDLIV
jgi:hypothetical protein